MKEITLTQGKYALVDDEDFEYLNQFKWFASKHRESIFYAARSRKKDEKDRPLIIMMHRDILKITDRKIQADHKDRNGLNNQKNNLRIATPAQNNANRNSRKNSHSKYLGVTKCKGRWMALIREDGTTKYLGNFDTETEAAKAYNVAAERIHGEFANLNTF